MTTSLIVGFLTEINIFTLLPFGLFLGTKPSLGTQGRALTVTHCQVTFRSYSVPYVSDRERRHVALPHTFDSTGFRM